MSNRVYQRLARRLDAIPNGFPATESGVELKLLAKMFAPEEAELASVMRLTAEPAGDIATRAGVDLRVARRLLKGMARKGLIGFQREDRQLAFSLWPFVVGVYEAQLPRLDAELARLFEQYLQETAGGLARDLPSVHRVIPVEEAIPFDLRVLAYQRATEIVARAKAWAVRDCICRLQQRIVGKGCDRPVENCLVLAPVEGAFDHSEVDRAITKEEALQILREAEEAGLVHSTGNHRGEHNYICNCCTCCCGILRGVAEFGIPTAVARSEFRAAVDTGVCVGCGDCIARCQFGALSLAEDVCVVDHNRCVGCGLCISSCLTGALRLEHRPEEETAVPPADLDDWMAQRARERSISLADVL